MPKTKYVADWLARAEEDVQVGQLLLEQKGPANIICFHAQQAAEKYLKGFLAFHEKHVRKVHDLKFLLSEAEKIDQSLASLQKDIAYLDEFYIETRYPADIPEFSSDQAQKAIKAAVNIETFILATINTN